MALPRQCVEKDHHTEVEDSEFERAAFGRWEYVNGETRRMAGGLLRAALLSKDRRVYGSDMTIHTGDGVNTFPDVAVVCEDRINSGAERL